MNPRRNTRQMLVITGVTLALGVAACASNGSTSPAPSTTAVSSQPSTTPISPVESAKQQALAAYHGMWQDVAEAATTSDWQSPRLADHATGDALSVLSRQLYADHYNGLVSKGKPVNSPVVESVEPSNEPKIVLIRDCSDAGDWLKYRADNGQPADNQTGGKHLINAEVKLAVDGSWRVTRFAVQGTGSC